MWPPRTPTSMLLDSTNFPVYFQKELRNKSKMRAILQAISLPSRSVKKNLEAAERQFQSEFSFLISGTLLPSLLFLFVYFLTIPVLFLQTANQVTSRGLLISSLKISKTSHRLGNLVRKVPDSSGKKWRTHGVTPDLQCFLRMRHNTGFWV